MSILERIEREDAEFTELAEQILDRKCYGKAWSSNRNCYPATDMLKRAAELTVENNFTVLAVATPVRTPTRLLIESEFGIKICSMVDLVKKATLDQLILLEKYGDLIDKE
jgi:hypothetical protein